MESGSSYYLAPSIVEVGNEWVYTCAPPTWPWRLQGQYHIYFLLALLLTCCIHTVGVGDYCCARSHTHTHLLTHSLTHTHGGTPLDERSANHGDLQSTTQYSPETDNRARTGFEPTIAACEQPQTYQIIWCLIYMSYGRNFCSSLTPSYQPVNWRNVMIEVPLAAAAATDCRFRVCYYCSSMEHYLPPSQYFRATFPPNNKPVGSFTVFRCRGDIRLFWNSVLSRCRCWGCRVTVGCFHHLCMTGVPLCCISSHCSLWFVCSIL